MFQSVQKSNFLTNNSQKLRTNSISKKPPTSPLSIPIQCMMKSAKNFGTWKKDSRSKPDHDLVDQINLLIQTYLHLTSQRADVVSMTTFGMQRMIHEILKEQLICLHRLENLVIEWNSRHTVWQKELEESDEVRIYAQLMEDIYAQQKHIIGLMKAHHIAIPMPSDLGIELVVGQGGYSKKVQKEYERNKLSKYLFQLAEGFKLHCRIGFSGSSQESRQAEGDFSVLCYLLSHTRTGCAILRELYHLFSDQFHCDLTVRGHAQKRSKPEMKILTDRSLDSMEFYLPKVEASAQWVPVSTKKEGLFSQQYGLSISPPQISFAKAMAGVRSLNTGTRENVASFAKRIEEDMRGEMGLPLPINSNHFVYKSGGVTLEEPTLPIEDSAVTLPSSLSPKGIYDGHALQFPVEILEHPKFKGFWNMVFDQPKMDFASVQSIVPVGSGNNSQTFFLRDEDMAGNPADHVFKFFSNKGSRGDNIEKEAIANNVVRLLGRRVSAPECKVINTDDKNFIHFVENLSTSQASLDVKEEFMDAYDANKEDEGMVVGLLMSRVAGMGLYQRSTPPSRSNRQEKRPLDPLNQHLFETHPSLHLALGELAAYNLLLGNGDSMLTVMNPNNMLFDVKGQRVNVFDQSLSLYDMVFIANLFTKGYNWLGSKALHKLIENPEAHSQDFDLIKINLSKAIPSVVKEELRCFMEERYTDSAFIARTVERSQKYFVNVSFNPMLLSTGFAEGCLRMFEQSNLLELFERIRCLTFPHEYEVFLQNWQSVERVVDKMGYDRIRQKIRENEAKMLSEDYTEWQHKSEMKQIGDRKMKRPVSLQ